MILSISFRALVEPPLDGVFEHSSGSKFSLVLPAFLFPLSLFSVLEQSVLATLLRVSQSHFEAPSGPFLEGSNAGPTHLGSKRYNYVLHSLSVWKDAFQPVYQYSIKILPVQSWIVGFSKQPEIASSCIDSNHCGLPC